MTQILNCGDKVHPSQIYIDETTHLLHKIFTHANRFISQLIFKCTNIENSSFTKLFMNSPPMPNNVMVLHAIHVPLIVVSSISRSEKLQKLPTRVVIGVRMQLACYCKALGKCSWPLRRAISNRFTTIWLTHLK